MRARGQSLLELVIAVGIIAAGLVGILTLTQASVRAWTEGVRRVQAAYFAAEGIELTRNAIETNEAADRPWWQGFRDDGTMTIDTRGIGDFTSDDFSQCAVGSCAPRQDAAGFFHHDEGGVTPFSRL